MHKKALAVAAIICFSMLFSGSHGAYARCTPCGDDGLRCSGQIVSIDDTKSEVLSKCGEPFHIETWEEERARVDHYYRYFDRHDGWQSAPAYIKEMVKIEEWTYNFGPTRFLYYLTFENGRLTCIETGDYGY
jgi:hypothetical protein